MENDQTASSTNEIAATTDTTTTTTTTTNESVNSAVVDVPQHPQLPPTDIATTPQIANSAVIDVPQHPQSPPTDTPINHKPTDTAADVDQSQDLQELTSDIPEEDQSTGFQASPINDIDLDRPKLFQLSSIDSVDTDQPTGIQFSTPIITINADESENSPSSPTNTDTTIDTATNLQAASRDITTVNEIKNVQTPLTNTATTVIDHPLLIQPAPSETGLAKETATTPKRIEDSVIVDDPLNSQTQTPNKPPTATTPHQKISIVSRIRRSPAKAFMVGVVLVISLLQLIIGWRYADDCPIHWRIPNYLLVAGCIGLTTIILCIIYNALRIYTLFQPINTNIIVTRGPTLVTIIGVILFLMTIVWWIGGCIWVFRVWNKVQYTHRRRANYCRPILYRFAYSLLLATVCCAVLLAYAITKQIRRLAVDRKKGPATLVPTSEP